MFSYHTSKYGCRVGSSIGHNAKRETCISVLFKPCIPVPVAVVFHSFYMFIFLRHVVGY